MITSPVNVVLPRPLPGEGVNETIRLVDFPGSMLIGKILPAVGATENTELSVDIESIINVAVPTLLTVSTLLIVTPASTWPNSMLGTVLISAINAIGESMPSQFSSITVARDINGTRVNRCIGVVTITLVFGETISITVNIIRINNRAVRQRAL